MAGDHHHDHHHDDGHTDPNIFAVNEMRGIVGFLIAFLAYFLSQSFCYIENDPDALARASSRGLRVEWTSFDKFYVQSPAAFRQPANHLELLAILAEARHNNQSLKVVGSGHSWSPIGLTDGVMINLDKFNQIVKIDAEKKLVTVEAGIRIRDLSQALAEHNPPLALKNTGVLNRQSLAGALATGTHGTGPTFPIMSAEVRALELVTAAGEVWRVSREDEEEEKRDIFEAATIHLGALGIITEVTLEVQDAFSVIKRNRLLPLTTVLENLPELATSSDHLLVWYIPYTDTAQLLESNRTARGSAPPPTSSFFASLMLPLRPYLGVLQVRFLSAAGWLSSLFPLSIVPLTNKWLVAPALHMFASHGEGIESYYAEGYKGICLDDHPDVYREAEWFMPLEVFPKAFAAFQLFLETHKERLGANFVVQLRMTKKDDLWLSPFRGDAEWYVSVATLVKGYDCEPYFKAAEEEIWVPHGAKPHWGKLHFLTYAELSGMYKEGLEKFLSVRRKLDPQDVFLNKHLRDLFVPRALR